MGTSTKLPFLLDFSKKIQLECKNNFKLKQD